MFQTLKRELDLVEVASSLLDKEFNLIGDNTYGPEDKECPFCGHKDCFRIKHIPEEKEESFFKCFSCDENGDVVKFASLIWKEQPYVAGLRLAKEFNIQLPRDFSPNQLIFNLAAEYYAFHLHEDGAESVLAGLTPLEFQVQRRGHSEQTLRKLRVGWSDGGLVDYLISVGFPEEVIKETGLWGKRKDFLPARCFIYPHYIDGKVSHFTFKDPSKKLEYQLPNKYKLNGHTWYGQESLKEPGPIAVCEGENDRISLIEAEWPGPVIASIGSLSGAQVEFLVNNYASEKFYTFFDNDGAGDKYRDKFEKIRRHIGLLKQYKTESAVKDIDEFLKGGGDLQHLLNNAEVKPSSTTAEKTSSVSVPTGENGVEIEVDDGQSTVFEKDNAYYKIKFVDGEPKTVKLSNFVIRLKNIYINNSEREREIVIIREDGYKSEPVIIPSEAKVNIKPFKVMVANAADASFYGRDEDMTLIWEYVYRQDSEKIVYLPENVGHLPEFNGWLFGDCFIHETGATYRPDETGVIWINGSSLGIKPIQINTNGKPNAEAAGVPRIWTSLDYDERKKLLGDYCKNLTANLGGSVHSYILLGWLYACAYSDALFKANGSFPFIFLFGRNSKGKTTIIKWLLSVYGMEDHISTISQLNTGVGFNRKLAYYGSLPVAIDEIRSDRETVDFYGTFRAYYNRIGRTTGDRDSTFGIKTSPVRSTILFGGQDQFTDDATRQRCVPIEIGNLRRELDTTYQWFQANQSDFPAIGFHWVTEVNEASERKVVQEVRELEMALRKLGIPSRVALNWAVVGHFGNLLAEEYAPEINFVKELSDLALKETQEQKEEDFISSFFEIVAGIQSMENSPLTGEHLLKEGDKLYLWLPEVYRIVSRSMVGTAGEVFSKKAVLAAIQGEEYYLGIDRQNMGVSRTQRRVVAIDITKAPEPVQGIAHYCENCG